MKKRRERNYGGMFGMFAQGHPAKSSHKGKQVVNTSKALMVVDSKKFRKKLMASYKRYKSNLSKLEAELTRFSELDQPAYERFMARSFGQEQSTLRELNEKMNLASFRIGQIHFVASRSGMSSERFCAVFRLKWPKEEDFWNALNEEAKKIYEKDAKEQEEYRRRQQEEYDRVRNSECDEDDEEEDEEDEDGFDIDDALKKILESLGVPTDDFENGPSLHVSGMDNEEVDEARELKRLYRELCLQYHPDKMGTHDAKMAQTWLDIQTAYQNGDLDRLKAIRAGLDLMGGEKNISCSDIMNMIEELKGTMSEIRYEVRSKKRDIKWEFSTLGKEKLDSISEQLKKEYLGHIRYREMELDVRERLLNNLLYSYKRPIKPVAPKKPKVKKKHYQDPLQGDLPLS